MSLIPAFKIGIWNAWLFMSVFIFQLIPMLFADKQIREKSHVPQKARSYKSGKYAGITGNIACFLALGYSVFLPLQLSTVWFNIGLAIFIVGMIFMATATIDFITTPADQLITKGVYQLSRHPMYLATFLICLGSGIATISWIFIFLSLMMIFCFHQEALIEERYCHDKYGSAYQEYMKRVPRWFDVLK
jgi:protein-S-isoprenylcysteine O-methyltransferase Ste14